MQSSMPIPKTFLKNRKCLYCKKPIADQQHATLKFCEHTLEPDSGIKNCKHAYHAALRKIKDDPYLKLEKHHKTTTKSIGVLLIKKGSNVSGDDLDQYGIQLNKPVEFNIPPSQKGCYSFIGFDITHIDDNKFKITKHETTIQQ